MPCLYITTNVNLEGVDTDPIFFDASKAVASIIGKPEHFVMVILKGSVAISFNGNKEAAPYVEIVSMGGINKKVKRESIAKLGMLLEKKLSFPKTRFFLKVYDKRRHDPFLRCNRKINHDICDGQIIEKEFTFHC